MFERNEALALVMKNCADNFSANDFEVKTAEVAVENDKAYFEIAKNSLVVRFSSQNAVLEILEKEDDGDFAKKATFLLDLETFDDRDAKSLANEVKDVIDSNYGKKARKEAAAKKAPATVSKAAVKGGMSYDANTLASKIAAMYPDLKEPYKENFQMYDEFLPEEFFVTHANAYIMETLRSNDSKEIKKLIKLLSEIYENGTNDVQDLVVVTILGDLESEGLVDKCCEYIEDQDFKDTLCAVNKYLASKAGKKAKKLLENPPKYKPEKKKQGLMAKMMAQQGQIPQR